MEDAVRWHMTRGRRTQSGRWSDMVREECCQRKENGVATGTSDRQHGWRRRLGSSVASSEQRGWTTRRWGSSQN